MTISDSPNQVTVKCSRSWPPPRRYASALVALLLALAVSPALAGSSRNVSLDAVTRATIWNSFSGDLAVLNDGQVPPEAPDTPPFVWMTKGILVFEWDGVVPLEKVRIYVGDVGNDYQIRTYVGGRLDRTGTLRDPEGEQTAFIEVGDRVVDQWVEVLLPEETRADNIELWALGPTVFYEVEILVRSDETAVQPISWSRIKALSVESARPANKVEANRK